METVTRYLKMIDYLRSQAGKKPKEEIRGIEDYSEERLIVEDSVGVDKLQNASKSFLVELNKLSVPKLGETRSGNKLKYFFEVVEGDYYLVEVNVSRLKHSTRVDKVVIHRDPITREYATAYDSVEFSKGKAELYVNGELMKRNTYFKSGKLKK